MSTQEKKLSDASDKKTKTKSEDRGKLSASGKTHVKASRKVGEPEGSAEKEKSPVVRTNTVSDANNNNSAVNQSSQDCMMDLLRSIRNDQTTLVNRIDLFEGRLSNIEEADYGYDQYENYDETDNIYGPGCSAPISDYRSPLEKCYPEKDAQQTPESDTRSMCNVNTSSSGNSSGNSRFDKLASKFLTEEIVSEEVDSGLAANVNNLFRNGLSADVFDSMSKDETCARPKNCEGLVVVKLNKLIWDLVPAWSRNDDKKLQNVEKAIVKAGVHLTKSMHELAKLEENGQTCGNILESCNDALALLGQANVHLNHTRRDFLRPELNEYASLCNHSHPFTSELFGDDVPKAVREIEECNKMGNRMQSRSQYGQQDRSQYGQQQVWGRAMFRRRGFRGPRRGPYGRGFPKNRNGGRRRGMTRH